LPVIAIACRDLRTAPGILYVQFHGINYGYCLSQAWDYRTTQILVPLTHLSAISVKIVCNEKEGGSGRWGTIDIGPWRSVFFGV
jgi:hypothetical protein